MLVILGAVPTHLMAEHDSLMPSLNVDKDWERDYSALLNKHFKLDQAFEARMLIESNRESVVSLHRKDDPMLGYILTYRSVSPESKSSIWGCVPRPKSPTTSKEVKIYERTASLPKELGDRLVAVWSLMMNRVSNHTSYGLDGATYVFSTKEKTAETWSPRERKSPLLFVELGRSLMDYCRTERARRHLAGKDVWAALTAWEDYLKKNP
jgi:hypothetical protein